MVLGPRPSGRSIGQRYGSIPSYTYAAPLSRGHADAALGVRGLARRSLDAILTRCAREPAFIFRITLPRCALTVISLMPSSPPTRLLGNPETTSVITSRSRGVSDP